MNLGLWLAIALLAPILVYGITKWNKQVGAHATTLATAGLLAFSLYLQPYIGTTHTFYLMSFRLTELGWFFALVVAVTYFATALFNPYWMDKFLHPSGYNFLFLLSLVATFGLFFGADLITLFISWELVVWSSMFIVPLGKSRHSAVLYYGISAFGSMALLYGILYVGTMFQTFDLYGVLGGLSQSPTLAAILFFLFAFSGLTKLGIFPFHVWLPAAHSTAPHTFSPVLSGGLVKMGAYMIFLVVAGMNSYEVFGSHFHVNGIPLEIYILMVLGAISIVVGTIMAIRQEDAKRLLAYSSVANGGYILIGLLLADQFGTAGSLMHIFNHAVATAAAFLSIAAVAHRTGTTKMSELGGLIHRMPITYTVYLIAIISLAGIPPMGGFVSKWLILQSLAGHGLLFIALAAFFGSIGSFLYVFRPLSAVFLGQLSPRHETVKEAEVPMIISMVGLSALVLFFGVLPESLLSVIGRIQASFGIKPIEATGNLIQATNGRLDTIVVFFVFGFGFLLALVMFLLLPKAKKVGLMDTYTSAEFIHTPELLHYSHDFYVFIERLYAKHPSVEKLYDAFSLRIREAGQLITFLFFSHKPGVTVLWTTLLLLLVFLGGVAL